MKRLIDLSAEHRYLVIGIVLILSLAGWWCMVTMPLDVLPNLGDTQVIITTDWDRSPEVMEDEVTYPLVNALQGTPEVKSIRAVSSFGSSIVYVIFNDGAKPEWARARVLEGLAGANMQLPEGAKPRVGPPSSGVDWVFQYALVDESGRLGLTDLRRYQKTVIAPALKALPGVAEVASVGGNDQQFQVNVDPARLLAYSLSIRDVVNAVRDGSSESAGRSIEMGGTEYMVRGRGTAHTLDDFAAIVVKPNSAGAAIRIRDVGQVTMGPEARRGVADLNGRGEVVSGIVVARSGEDTLSVTERVKARLAVLQAHAPAGVKVDPVYDRSTLIHEAIRSLRSTLIAVLLTVAVIILLFLWHFPSAVIPVITIPVTLLITFIPLRLLGYSANIMSLAGLAIASSELVNASIIVVEQTHKRLEEWNRFGGRGSTTRVVVDAVKSVAGPTFFALLIMAVSFLPVFALEAQEGRLFKPFALSKTIAMAVAALLTLTLDPALRVVLVRTERFATRFPWLNRGLNAILVPPLQPEERHPISRTLNRLYQPVVLWTLRHRALMLGGVLGLMALTVPIYLRLTHEFMPDLYEGSFLYMPATMPGLPIAEARRLLTSTDRVLAQFPEVDQVLGKAGRADTATDPAPLSMFETLIILKPRGQWRHVHTWYSDWAPAPLLPMLRHITPDTISREDLVQRMDEALRLPGFNNVWTMPIRGRLDMLSTGIRTPLGLKVAGPDTASVEGATTQIAAALHSIDGAHGVFTEHTGQGHFLDVTWKREELARYGLRIADVQDVVANAIGGENVTAINEGHLRIPVNVRLMRGYRTDPQTLARLVVSCGGSCQVPVGQLADITVTTGPDMIRDEDGQITGYVFVDLAGGDPKAYIAEARRPLGSLALQPGVSFEWSGQYESIARVGHRLNVVLPLTLVLVALLLWLSTRSWSRTLIILLAVPFSAIGAVGFLFFAGYHLSTAVLVGIVALMGVDAETGVFMMLYLDLAYEEARRSNRLRNRAELHAAILQGAARRVRPKFMTFATTCLGLFPILWSSDLGSDLLKRIAAPMAGGITTSFLLELLIYPVLYELWRGRSLPVGAPGHLSLDRMELLNEGVECKVSLAPEPVPGA